MLPSRNVTNNNGVDPDAENSAIHLSNTFPASCYNNARTPFAIQEILGLGNAMNMAAAVGMPMRPTTSNANELDGSLIPPNYFIPGTQNYNQACFLDQGNIMPNVSHSSVFPLDVGSNGFIMGANGFIGDYTTNNTCERKFNNLYK